MESKELEQAPAAQSNVLDRLPFNLTQLLAFAMKKPRDQHTAMDNAISQLRAAPQFAEKAYYSIPFKRRNPDGTYSEEIVEGPSIKAATALTGCWGNNVEGGFLGEENNDYVDTFGYYFDYETGKLTVRAWRVSKTYRTKEGKVVPWRYDMLQKQIQAGLSKAIRNADLNGLPAGYIAEYYAEAKRIAARGGKLQEGDAEADVRSIQAQMDRTLGEFKAKGINATEIQDYVLRHRELDTEEAVVAHLIGLMNALEAGETTVDEAFAVPEGPIPEPQRTAPKVAAATPAPAAKTRELPKDRKRMQSKFEGSTCSSCGKAIKKGDWIYKNDADRWVHEVGPSGVPC